MPVNSFCFTKRCHITVFQDLFFKYSWNNFLHTQVEHCVSTILNNPPSEEDGKRSCPLINVVSLFYKTQFPL